MLRFSGLSSKVHACTVKSINSPVRKKSNQPIHMESLVACCWAGAVTIPYIGLQVFVASLLMGVVAQIVLLCCQYASFQKLATNAWTDGQTNIMDVSQSWVCVTERKQGGFSSFFLFLVLTVADQKSGGFHQSVVLKINEFAGGLGRVYAFLHEGSSVRWSVGKAGLFVTCVT